MKEVKLSEKDLYLIRSNSITSYVASAGEYGLITSVIDSFIALCNTKGYIVKDGKIIENDKEVQKRDS